VRSLAALLRPWRPLAAPVILGIFAGLAASVPANSQDTSGSFDFYVLALSWSPSFCAGTGDRQGRDQCAIGTRLGFTVHGLWPQYDRGYPSDCSAYTRSPTRAALEKTEGVYPDMGLARYEWRKHGTCSGKSPGDYFDDVRSARDKVKFPEALQSPASDQRFSPRDIARAFIAANPGLHADNLGVTCRQARLEEVRICFDKDLRGFHSCPEVVRQSCRSWDIAVPPVR
jgi:ribonuclease T2